MLGSIFRRFLKRRGCGHVKLMILLKQKMFTYIMKLQKISLKKQILEFAPIKLKAGQLILMKKNTLEAHNYVKI